jgi:hypothetical protein
MDNSSVLTFKAITGFISDLHAVFGAKHKSIALYNRLLEKTGLVNVEPIHKHIECFRKFFAANKQAMEEKNAELFTDSVISYSDRVYVDMKTVLKQSTPENVAIIWKHMLTIWGLVDPTSQAKRMLRDSINHSNGQDRESQFLSDIIEKVEKTVGNGSVDTANPMASITNLMNSGVFTDLITGMQQGLTDGSLDIGKLMSSVQGMMSKMGGGNAPDLSAMMSMMSGGGGAAGGAGASGMPDLGAMMSMMGGGGAAGGAGASGMPDLSAMMSMMGPMLQNMQQPPEK